ncbi:MAG: hypothetical protein GY841_10325 [FCB group bacterium]|nr:hypothetical protein [FCB group bacterium]
MIVLIILFAILYGYLAHQTRRFIYARFGNGWRELVSYAAGVLFVFPVFALVAWVLSEHNEKATQQAALAYYMSFLPFGLGTFLGWLSDGGSGAKI